MIELPELPASLDEIHRRNAEFGESYSVGSTGYEEALRRCNNADTTGSGVLATKLKEKYPNKTPHRTFFFPVGMWEQGPYGLPGGHSTQRIADIDAVTFPPRPGILAEIAQLRRFIPPTLPVPLTKGAERELTKDPSRRPRKGKVEAFLTNARTHLTNNVEGEQSVITGEIDVADSALDSEDAKNAALSRKFVRANLAETRGVSPDDITLFYGAEEALVMTAALLRKGFIDVIKTHNKLSIPPHDYRRFMILADLLGYKMFPLNIDYNNPEKTHYKKEVKLVYFSNPNNPHGQTLSVDEIESLLKKFDDETTVIIDTTGISHKSSVAQYTSDLHALAQTMTQHIIIIGSTSKEEQSPWLRIGFAISNRSVMHDQLRLVEAHIPPNLGRVFSNRMTWVEDQGLRAAEREYMKAFYETLTDIEKRSDGRMRIYRPESAIEAKREPSGYYCVIEFKSDEDSRRFNELLIQKGTEQFNMPIIPPMQGGNRRLATVTPRHSQLDPKSFNRPGMPYMPTKSHRLCTTGSVFTLTALAEILGIT
ncbi:MAG: aminotransferase class I/II-fold pyridoxal phosphate-dependent enzyme [bacterium]|nr:aminotransferase class I/II-fold pyridoxal phosphate-dependent enzyme [bacterium]MDZ4245344.1 aminotransferase class I/II-fold pyridoxal phosphate-dependent enzyme [Candidatus Gracilibacteria bacterium]